SLCPRPRAGYLYRVPCVHGRAMAADVARQHVPGAENHSVGAIAAMTFARSAIACAVASLVCGSLHALAADFYAGKTIEIIAGSDVGGGYDIYARAIARHIGRHIPGNPAIVVKNMPGAGSTRAAGYLNTVAPKDGTVLAAVFPSAIIGGLLDDRV